VATPVLAVRPQRRRHASAVDAALVYVVLRLVSAALMLLTQSRQPAVPGLSRAPYLGMVTHWDAQWFHSIAMSGYPRHLPYDVTGAVARNQWAFYPGFPSMTRAVMQLTDTGFAASATLVDVVCGLVAAIAMDRLLETRIPRAAALAVVAVWAALPMSPSLQLAYSEALALALLSLTLLWLQREHWARAAVAAVLLGLTRPMLPPLAVVFAIAVWLRWRRRATDPVLPAERRQMLAGLLATAAGSAVWPVVAWWVTGVPNAYSRTEAAWHHHGVLAPFAGVADLHQVVWHGQILWLRVAVIAALVVAVSLTVVAVRSPRIDPLLATWCVAYLAFDLAVGNMHADEFRLLLPLFPLVAVACGVASARLAPHWRERAWLGLTLGIVGQYAWLMLCVRFLPGVPRAP
jgi:hypothetical protein